MNVLQHLHIIEHLAPAYLVYAPLETTFADLKEFAQQRAGGPTSPDLFCSSYEQFTVDDARSLAAFAVFKPLGEKKYIVISAGRMTDEAQHALLKVVEDGAGDSTFFFNVATGTPVLPTLVSRCVAIKQTALEHEQTKTGEAFLQMSYADRLLVAERFGKEGDREGARALVRSLLTHTKEKHFHAELLRDLLEADEYLKLSGSSPKSVIGHLALVL